MQPGGGWISQEHRPGIFGQFGHARIRLRPTSEADFIFNNKIVGGVIPKEFIKPIEQGIKEALETGPLAGFPVTGVEVDLYEGSYHEVDSSEMAFKIAGSMAFQDASKKARPVIMEPIMSVEVVTPEEYMGDVIGDLNSRRGKVLGMDTNGHTQVIKCRVPMSEVLKYAPDLRSLTSGRGEFHLEFSHYEELPPHLAEKVIKEAKARQGADQQNSH